MYLEFYGLTSKPFELLPDPRFLYVSRGLDSALTSLEEGIANHKPLIVLSGEVGTGKTTLLNFLLKKIRDDTHIALIVNPNLEPQEFLELVLRRFRGVVSPPQGVSPFEELHSLLLEQRAVGRRSILIVDEAQNIPMETLEQVRLLTNLQTDSDNLLQVILSGQPQLRQRLKTPELAELAQRISVYYHLYPLEKAETERYIQHRLAVSGYCGEVPLFSPEAVQQIHHYTNGVPRLINSVCDTALIYGFSEDAPVLGLDIVQKTIKDRYIQIGDNGVTLDGFRNAPPFYERIEPAMGENVPSAPQGVAEEPFGRPDQALQPSSMAPDTHLREKPDLGNDLTRTDGESNIQLRDKADLIARHYRNLWSLNQKNRERLTTLGANYRLLWKHCEQLRKENAALVKERRLQEKQLKAKDDRIRALEDAFRELLGQNRALKKLLRRSEVHLGVDPERHKDLSENPHSPSE